MLWFPCHNHTCPCSLCNHAVAALAVDEYSMTTSMEVIPRSLKLPVVRSAGRSMHLLTGCRANILFLKVANIVPSITNLRNTEAEHARPVNLFREVESVQKHGSIFKSKSRMSSDFALVTFSYRCVPWQGPFFSCILMPRRASSTKIWVRPNDLPLWVGWSGSLQSQVEGNFVKDGQNSFGRLGAGAGRILGYQSDSHEKTLAKGLLPAKSLMIFRPAILL